MPVEQRRIYVNYQQLIWNRAIIDREKDNYHCSLYTAFGFISGTIANNSITFVFQRIGEEKNPNLRKLSQEGNVCRAIQSFLDAAALEDKKIYSEAEALDDERILVAAHYPGVHLPRTKDKLDFELGNVGFYYIKPESIRLKPWELAQKINQLLKIRIWPSKAF